MCLSKANVKHAAVRFRGFFFARCVECRLDFHLQCDGPLHLPATIVHVDDDGHRREHDPLILTLGTSSTKDDRELTLHCDFCKKE